MSALYNIMLATIALSSGAASHQGQVEDVAAEAAPPSSVSLQHGDRVTLKSGRVLQGVKVVRTTPFKLYLEIIPTVEPLAIPTKQVMSISYGESESYKRHKPVPVPENLSVESARVMQAVKISPELAKQMARPITEKEVLFEKQDLLNTLRSAGIMCGITVTFGPQLEELSPEERTFSLRLAGGLSFEEFYRNTLLPQIPWLNMEYRFDTVYFESEVDDSHAPAGDGSGAGKQKQPGD